MAATVILGVLVMYALLFLFSLPDRQCGVSAGIFACINIVILILLVLMRSSLAEILSPPTFIQLWSISIVYTVVQFVHLFLAVNIWKINSYTVFQLIILAVWLAIIGAIITINQRKT